MEHFSWDNNTFEKGVIEKYQKEVSLINSSYKSITNNFQHNLIPVIDLNLCDLQKKNIQEMIYNLFFNERGTIIFKNMYPKYLMNRYNAWTEQMLEQSKKDKNSTHPKQADKLLINDVILRMAETDCDLLMDIIFDKNLNKIMDIILGFGTYGSCTGHWINPGGKRQTSHVDYPIHIGSGKFWENSLNKLKKTTTEYQINHILPFFSFQLLIASDKMNEDNGSTEVVPCSHLIKNMDLIIHDKEVYKIFEKYFVNVELEQGDMLIFNRRLCHRGGENKSSKRRNALIIQSVYLWGIGQEIIETEKVMSYIKKTTKYKDLTEEEKQSLLLRLRKPYPTNVKKNA